MKGRLVEYGSPEQREGKPGDFWFFGQDRGLQILRLGYYCPHCGDLRQIPLESKEGSASWQWDGNKDNPTITPSIQHVQSEPFMCGWHGWLRNGEWITA